jgi:hypothetical protein
MPQYSVTRTGGGLPTSDYAIGLDQAFATAESMRNQRRRNQQAANIMKQTMAAKGLAGTVEVDGEGEIDAQADKASLKRFFGKDKLDATDTTDNAMLSWIDQRNNFKKDASFESQVVSHQDELEKQIAEQQKQIDADSGAYDAIAAKAQQLAGGPPITPKTVGGPTNNPTNPQTLMNILQGGSTPSNGTPLLSAMNSATSPSLAAVANSSVPSFTPPMADPNAPVKSPMQLLQERMGTSAPSNIDSIKTMMESSGVTNDSLPDNIKQALNDKSLAMKDLDTQIALENKKGSGIINPDGSPDSPINDEAMKRIADMQAQKKALNEDKDLMSQIAAMAQQQGQPTPQAPDPAKAQAAIQSIVNPLGLTATPQANPTLNPLLTQSGAAGSPSGGTAAASGGTTGGTSPTGGTIKQGGGSQSSQRQELKAEKEFLKLAEAKDTIITRSTDGADYQDTMPYSMGTLLAQQGYRDAISAGAGDAVGMQMNPFNAMLRDKVASINNRNIAAQAANKVNSSVTQGGTKVEYGTKKVEVSEGASQNIYNNTTVSAGNTKGPSGPQQPQTNYRLYGQKVDIQNGRVKNTTRIQIDPQGGKGQATQGEKNVMNAAVAYAKNNKVSAKEAMRNVIGDMYKNDSQYLFNNPDAFVDSLNDLETNGLTNLHFDSPQGGDGYNFTIKNGKIIPDKNTKVSFKDIISNKSYKSYKFYDPQKEVERKVEFNLDDFKGEVGTNLDLKQETLSSILLGGTVDNL